MKFKDFIELLEKVSRDCSTGDGLIPDGPYKGWKVWRTNHLDKPRFPTISDIERDEGFICKTFDHLITALLRKRPLGLKDGKTQITWKNDDGIQACMLDIDNRRKTITFITVMQLNKKRSTGYETKGAPSIDLGVLKDPK